METAISILAIALCGFGIFICGVYWFIGSVVNVLNRDNTVSGKLLPWGAGAVAVVLIYVIHRLLVFIHF